MAIDLRCEQNHLRGKIEFDGFIEIACPQCSHGAGQRVLHRWSIKDIIRELNQPEFIDGKVLRCANEPALLVI